MVRFTLMLAAVALIIGFFLNSLADDQPRHVQIVGDEICINYLCKQTEIMMAVVGDSVMLMRANGRTLEVPIQRTIIYKSRHIFEFKGNRGFVSVGHREKNVFMFIDKHTIIIHIKYSNITS